MSHRVVAQLGVVAAVIALVVVKVAVGQQPQGDPFSTAIKPLKDGLYVIPGYDGAATGGNVAVRVTNEGVIVVDDKLTESFRDIVEKIKSVTSQPVKYVLNTHQHGDHTGGNTQFMKTAEIIMHRNARANMVKGNVPGAARIVFNDQESVFLGGVEVQMLHLGRGHTNGDSIIYFPDLRTVHTGDLVVWGKRSQGTTLTPSIDYANGGGSGKDWVATLDKLLKLDFDTAIPGHGPVLTKDDVRTFRQKFQTLVQRMTDLIKSGVKKEEIAAKLKTDDLNWPFQPQALASLYDELAAKP